MKAWHREVVCRIFVPGSSQHPVGHILVFYSRVDPRLTIHMSQFVDFIPQKSLFRKNDAVRLSCTPAASMLAIALGFSTLTVTALTL
jgi:hypothetical protein